MGRWQITKSLCTRQMSVDISSAKEKQSGSVGGGEERKNII